MPGPPQGNLRGYVREALGAITRSWVACPWELCDLFSMLRGLAADRFPGRKELQYSVISVFLFLRFFAAAILSPKLFELCSHPIVSSTDLLPPPRRSPCCARLMNVCAAYEASPGIYSFCWNCGVSVATTCGIG